MKPNTNSVISKLDKEAEIAKFISVTKRTMRRYRKQGLVPFYRVGGIIRYDRDQVVRALNKFRVGGQDI